MFRLFFIFLILTGFKTSSTDIFKFPDKFYDLTFGSSTIKSVKSVFGDNCEQGGITTNARLVSGRCIRRQAKTLIYTADKLCFQFNENTKIKKYFLTSIQILTDSPITFGTSKMRTGLSHTSDLIKEFGQPTEKIDLSSLDSIYVYYSKQTQNEYSFIFLKDTKLLTSVKIKRLSE